jgi:hypothetical protein
MNFPFLKYRRVYKRFNWARLTSYLSPQTVLPSYNAFLCTHVHFCLILSFAYAAPRDDHVPTGKDVRVGGNRSHTCLLHCKNLDEKRISGAQLSSRGCQYVVRGPQDATVC